MTVATLLACLVLALCIDASAGYPDALYRRIGHPVTWIGALIGALETRLNHAEYPAPARRLLGVGLLLAIVALTAGAAFALQSALLMLPYGTVLIALPASTLIASRSLHDHVRDVSTALTTGGIEAGRAAVGHIVGRDTAALDESAVARAAIESLAENASDGVIAPVLWFALLGLPGIAAYKAINTADSMIGHRTERYEAFGWAAARLDDLVNLPASRATGLLFAAAASLHPGVSPANALRTMARDAPRHRSPNAGWPEAAMAGALDLKLAGPRTYAGTLVDDAYMGDGRRELTSNDIDSALILARSAWVIMLGLALAAAFIAR